MQTTQVMYLGMAILLVIPDVRAEEFAQNLKRAVRETLSGCAGAAIVTERERMERLARMTPQEARAIYDVLCQSWSAQRDTQDLERLERWRLGTLLALRHATWNANTGAERRPGAAVIWWLLAMLATSPEQLRFRLEPIHSPETTSR